MAQTTTYHDALQMGSMLLEYRLESVLGAGGFRMTYLGWDGNLEKTDRKINPSANDLLRAHVCVAEL